MKLSIVIPIYFNENNLQPFYTKLNEVFIKLKEVDYEIVFVDDGSMDNSYAKMQELRKIDSNIKLIKLAKNFGSHVAILAGLTYCTGDCATVISADLQDPPFIILEMIEKYQMGREVILAVREDREESAIQKFCSNTYYRLMRRYALSNMPLGGFDCFLIDRKVIDVLVRMQEKNSSIMGQILWSGFSVDKIYYIRKEREIGKSRWTLSKKIKLFIDSFMAFSYVPIRMMTFLGILFSCISFIYAIIVFINKLKYGVIIEGWTSLMIIILLVSGIQLIFLGIIGEYLWRTMDESRKRPIFIVDKKEGFDEKN